MFSIGTKKQDETPVKVQATPIQLIQPETAKVIDMVKTNTDNVLVLTDDGGPHQIPAEQRRYMAYTSDGRLFVSQSHVTMQATFEFAGKMTVLGKKVERVVTTLEVIEALYKQGAGTKKTIADIRSTEFKSEGVDLINDAANAGASDIHIRVSKKRTEILYRINGDLIYQREAIAEYGEKLCTTLYQALSDTSDTNFKIKERQDARIGDKDKLPTGINGVRIATTPTDQGFLMVMRLLTDNNAPTLEALGWGKTHAHQLNFMKSRPYGMNIICGPTGSGKSTTLQRTLRDKIDENEGRIHVMTVEDPVEYPIPGAVQTSVTNASSSEERKRKFEDAIRASLRLDPDVIMIGELRDLSSAELAFHAALTGHQVWATLHANNPIGILDRLISMGLDRYLIADPNNLTGLISQNLVKVLCNHCKIPYQEAIDRDLVSPGIRRRVESVCKNIPQIHIRGDGCDQCKNTGVSGRTAVVEILVPDQTFMDHYLKQEKQLAISYWRDKQDGRTITQHVIEKIDLGIVDPSMAEAVVGPLNFDLIAKDFSLGMTEVEDAARP